MALFSKKQKPSIPGVEINTEDEILGYLDDVQRNRLSLTILGKGINLSTPIYDVDGKGKLIKVRNDSTMDENEGKPVKCGFPMDRTFYVFSSKIVMRGDRPFLELPSQILRKERRKGVRTNLSKREGVKVTALQSLGAGIGVLGMASDVSISGVCLIVDRAMNLGNERDIAIGRNMFEPGTELMVVKVNRIPGVPVFDTQGVVKRVFPAGVGQWRVALEFGKLPGKNKSLIEHFVKTRTPAFRPTPRSRKRRMEMDAARKAEEQEQAAEAAEAATETAAETAVNEEPPEDTGSKMKLLEVDPGYEPPPEPEDDDVLSEVELEPEAEPPGESLVSLGTVLDEQLAFLETDSDLDWIHVDNPVRIMRKLNERHPRFLLLPWQFNDQSMVDFLQKIHSMGVLKSVEVILFHNGDLPPREIVKSKMLGIKHILQYPLEDKRLLLDILRPAAEKEEVEG